MGFTIFYYVMFPGWVSMVGALVYSYFLSLSLGGRVVLVEILCNWAFYTDSLMTVGVLRAFSSLWGSLSCGEWSTGSHLRTGTVALVRVWELMCQL